MMFDTHTLLSDLPRKAIDNKMTFQDFLKFMQYFKNIADLSTEDRLLFRAFESLVYDINRCSIAGSSLLMHRLNRNVGTGDVDFFIEDTPENIKIVSDFLSRGSLMRKYYKYLGEEGHLLNPKHIVLLSRGDCSKYQDDFTNYGFTKSKSSLKTNKFWFNGEGFVLNFIFTKPELDDNSDKNFEQYPYNGRFFSSEIEPDHFMTMIYPSLLGDTTAEKKEMKKRLFDLFPKAIPLHLIDSTFDIEELKYVYSAELQQVITAKMAAKLLLLNFINRLEEDEYLNKYLDTIPFIKERILAIIDIINKDNEKFLKEFNNSNQVHLADAGLSIETIHFINSKNRQYNPVIEFDKATPYSVPCNQKIYSELSNFLLGATPRIKKYQDYGFEVIDSNNYITNSQLTLLGLITGSLENEEFEKGATKNMMFTGGKVGIFKSKIIQDLKKFSVEKCEESLSMNGKIKMPFEF